MKNKEKKTENFFGIMQKLTLLLVFSMYCFVMGGYHYFLLFFLTGISYYGLWYYDKNIKDK